VGIAPVPVAWIDSGALLVVGNSNRFPQPETPQFLDVLDAAKLRAGAGAAALVRTIPAGSFPRALTLFAGWRNPLFLSDYDSDSLQGDGSGAAMGGCAGTCGDGAISAASSTRGFEDQPPRTRPKT
jgi:hypothetical protein